MIFSGRAQRSITWVLFALMLTNARSSSASELRVEGSMGFGLTARSQGGDFRWDWNSTREDTSLAEIKLGIEPATNLRAFVRFGARAHSARQTDDAPVFELREGNGGFGASRTGGSSPARTP